ncbi:MAG: hypothetical protein IPK83_20800 [Planctomycetes bacterium]|nr:hypothetical protein [Planctomycetota bacterium]
MSARAEIIDLFREVMKHEGLSILMATHDLAAAAALSEYVYVMYAGQIVEHGAVESVLCNPVHPYTQALIRALPKIDQQLGNFSQFRE